MASREEVMVVITCTEDEIERGVVRSEQMLQKVDQKADETQRKLEEIAAQAAKQEHAMIMTYQNLGLMISSSFAVIRNMMRVFGLAMTGVQQAMMQMFEVVLRSVVDIHHAMMLAAKGSLTPFQQFITGAEIAMTVTSAAMLVVAQAQARQEFTQIQQRTQAMGNLLDIASRARI